jgi:hypothetical protein
MDWEELHYRNIAYNKAEERDEQMFLADKHPHNYHSEICQNKYRKRITCRRHYWPRARVKQIGKSRKQHRQYDDEVRCYSYI